ncbi:gluconate 2-dehydrogenase subunit 3 family protein [Cyclobacterium amurskyense]|uniref:Tat (Twin-arginine translocation) pathway signal sequence domain protein n=1 Tax=Cyclobacterium amurskyense TaxID=320787 RepID=A0A0H4PBR1_9BACT|nr:gluconate 2-dehydrogenase subunit 3 family protein [Cyclobacterium amurskyense]AKP51881.1 Tat (Twin-arginine translocation) pathway signal sequence domain protein [Cyclobacterium amurskyense]|tara:strand:+ start:108833 stop:109549 length:717 start_codon:yes stop_codon:yes gene_type:complete
MNRRENLKLLFTGSLASGILFTGCGPEKAETVEIPHNPKIGEFGSYGRTPEEIIHNESLKSTTFFTEDERKKLDILVDMIIPADDTSGSATDAGVPDFIEFMVKDIPRYQTPLRGGLLWLDYKSDEMFSKKFLEISEDQRTQVIDLIAYPDTAKPENKGGVKFFNDLRNLTATGFFTSEEGFKDLGYVGNRPNAWDGVPEEVLAKHGLENDPKYKDVYLDISTRGTIAQWDDNGNLIG